MLLVILILLLFASSGMYLIEGHMQPDKFGSIPQAAWWALATLTTVGYGDVVPVTPLGKTLGGVVMLLGVGMIVLPNVAIIATGFSQESTRHQFVVTWGMIARVPLFGSMDYSEIAEITKVLYTRIFMPGVPMVRARDAGDAMFIIASGEAVVEISPGQHALLKEGAFSPRWRCSNIGDRSMMSSPKCASAFMSSTACRWPG